MILTFIKMYIHISIHFLRLTFKLLKKCYNSKHYNNVIIVKNKFQARKFYSFCINMW